MGLVRDQCSSRSSQTIFPHVEAGLHLGQQVRSSNIAVLSSLALVAVINKNICHKMFGGASETALEFHAKACFTEHVENGSANHCPDGRGSAITLANSMRNGCRVIASKPSRTSTINSSDVMLQVLNAVKH